jgi:hypothetical protein
MTASRSVIRNGHHEVSSRSVIREAVIGSAVFFPKIICIKSLKCGIFAAQTASI